VGRTRSLSFLFACAWVWAGAASARAATYVLFTAPGVPASNYNEIVRKLGLGDEVVFSDGRKYRIEAKLGSESTTRVFDVGGGKAIRVPIQQGRSPLMIRGDFADFIDSYLEGYPTLRDRGVSVVKVYLEESLPREVVVVEKLNVRFHLDEFLRKDFKKRVTPEEYERLWAEFTEFARSTWAFRNIGDMREGQIAYTSRGWVLFDFTRYSTLASQVESGSIFANDAHDMRANMAFARGDVIPPALPQKLELPRERIEGISKAIEEERAKRGLVSKREADACKSIFSRVLSFFIPG
jgi:hypothetical protein